jgi:hypothetical protein
MRGGSRIKLMQGGFGRWWKSFNSVGSQQKMDVTLVSSLPWMEATPSSLIPMDQVSLRK